METNSRGLDEVFLRFENDFVSWEALDRQLRRVVGRQQMTSVLVDDALEGLDAAISKAEMQRNSMNGF